jgi:hypothetical protein
VTLIVFASLRVGEVLGLRWKRVLEDRLAIVERVYDGTFDDVKTDAGNREVPLDQRGVCFGRPSNVAVKLLSFSGRRIWCLPTVQASPSTGVTS